MTIKLKSEVIYNGDVQFTYADIEYLMIALEGFILNNDKDWITLFEPTYKKVAQVKAELDFNGLREYAKENAA